MIHATWVLICPACDLSNERWQPLIVFDLVAIPRCALSIASGNQPIWRCSNRSGDAGHMALAFRVVKGYRTCEEQTRDLSRRLSNLARQSGKECEKILMKCHTSVSFDMAPCSFCFDACCCRAS